MKIYTFSSNANQEVVSIIANDYSLACRMLEERNNRLREVLGDDACIEDFIYKSTVTVENNIIISATI